MTSKKNSTANENSLSLGRAYFGYDEAGCKSRRLKFRNSARELISRYWVSPQKQYPESPEYQFLERCLVSELDFAFRWGKPGDPESVKWFIECMARLLCIHPIRLYNDKDLPDFVLDCLMKEAGASNEGEVD